MQKTNFKTRLLALLTAVFMVVMCMPFAAFAASTDPAAREKIVVSFTKDNKTENVVLVKDSVSQNAPKVEGGKWVTDTKGAPELGSEAIMMWSEMDRWATGDWDNEAYISYTFKADEKEPEPVEKTANITFNAYDYGTLVGTENENSVTYAVKDVDGATVTVPVVKAIDGYKFTGWTSNLEAKLDADACGKEQFIAGWAYYQEGSTDGNIVFTAQFEKKEQPEPQKHHFTVNFTVAPDKGSFTDYGAGPVVFQGYEEEVGGQQYNVPAVTAKEGYKFVGWKGQGASEIAWGADAKTFGISGLCFYQDGSYEGNASIEAQFEEVKTEPEVKKTVSVTITTNNEQGIFPDYDGQEVIHFDNLDPNTDQQFELPKVEAKPGYEFIGWHVNGNEVGAWDADAKTFGITGLAHFEKGSNVGYLTIAAVYKAKTERTVEVTFSVDPDKGEFEKNDLYTSPAANVKKLTATEFDGTQYAIPTVKAKAGYKFVGWKGQGADVIAWNAEAKTFGVTGLCFFNGDDATTGYATVEAVFEKVEDKKNDNSSSSSSASSSSNKTTTASNEKQVVKTAAAPANTTKVLPKTGASHVAPLLGGSLAVVALLMGYGVYSLVLRKKD